MRRAPEAVLAAKEAEAPEVFGTLARAVMLQCIDDAWTGFS
jgi:preprotein translocase subunit SecA